MILFLLAIIVSVSPLITTAAFAQTSERDDTTGVVMKPPPNFFVPATAPVVSVFDTITPKQFHIRHSYSLGDYLEFAPGYFLMRRGPLGSETQFSRNGIGRGRGAVYLGKLRLNDPQNDRAFLPIVPTTAIGEMVLHSDGTHVFPTFSNIEGTIRVSRPPPSPSRPVTAIELSDGNRDLKQRRLRFSSAQGPIGLDYTYDELRNNGYPFDARELIGGSEFGRSITRVQGLGLRGELPDGERYRFFFQQYTSDFHGDLRRDDIVHRRNGHYGLLEATVGRVDLTLYERTFEAAVSDALLEEALEDSTTRNQTIGLVVGLPIITETGRELLLGFTGENIDAVQDIAGSYSADGLQVASVGAAGRLDLPNEVQGSFGLNIARQLDHSTAWGGRVALGRAIGSSNRLALEARRSYRLPNLGELFLPRHPAGPGGGEVEGNEDLDSEDQIEAELRLYSDYGAIENEARVALMHIYDPIQPSEVSTSPVPLVKPVHGDGETMSVFANRTRLSGGFLGFDVGGTAAFELGLGDDEFFFSGVPSTRVNASFRIGRAFFGNTSDLFFTAEYQYTGERFDPNGVAIDPYDVVNLRLDGRLIDAQLYLMLLNALDTRYETISPYLMTPRTFSWGIQWTLFD